MNVLATMSLALLLNVSAGAPADGGNAVVNGDFHDLGTYAGPVTTTSVGVPAGSLPTDWYGGPGVGATATYELRDFEPGQTEVPGDPKRYLRVTWSEPPSKDWPGEGHHQPAFRGTFLEYFGIKDVRRFSGQTVRMSFHARVGSGEFDLIPILWHSYDAETPGIVAVKGKGYELFESSGTPGEVAVAQGEPRPSAVCRLTEKWQRFEKIIALPNVSGKSITPGHYTGVGFDYHARPNTNIDIAAVCVEPLEAAPRASISNDAPR